MKKVIIFQFFVLMILSACNSVSEEDRERISQDSIARVEFVKDSLYKLTPEYEAEMKLIKIEEEKKEKIRSKYLEIINGNYEYSSTNRTRHNREGPKEYVFDADKLKKAMTRRGFNQIGGEFSNNYEGEDSGYEVIIKHGGSVASGSGWVQKWDIIVKKN